MPENLRYAGVPVYMNGRNYFIPSLSTKDFRANYDALSASPAEGGHPNEMFSQYIPIIGLALRRNYPDITDEQLEDMLDLRTFRLAIRAVQDASGMEPVTQGE